MMVCRWLRTLWSGAPVPEDERATAGAAPQPALSPSLTRLVLLRDGEVTPALTAKAVEVLHSNLPIGGHEDFVLYGESYCARVEMHGHANSASDPPHRGVTLYRIAR